MIVGGGLAGGLAALALRDRRPDVSVHLYEAGPALGGNHRWSWFASDVGEAGARLLRIFPQAVWPAGYDVRFATYERHLPTPYHSLASRDFDLALRRSLGQNTVYTDTPVAALRADGVTLKGGVEVGADLVIDCRDRFDAGALTGGWQVFLGQRWRLDRPHGLTRPIIMDARVAQHGGYRFVYVLPLSSDTVFLEDTYYQDRPVLDTPVLRERLARYAGRQGWAGQVEEEETGLLPVVSGGDFPRFQSAQASPGIALAGARGGFTHPLTSYTLPFALDTALWLAEQPDLTGPVVAPALAERARAHWRRTGFYRLLASMLFGAARPEERDRVFARFYRMRAPLIERFYAGGSTLPDKARVLAGRPPVPISRAVTALLSHRPSLAAPMQKVSQP